MAAQTQTPALAGRQMLRRCAFLAAVFGMLSLAVLLVRLYKLQITDHGFYEQLAISQQLREAPGTAARGVIYDRSGNLLAVSASVDNVYLSPAEIEANGEDRALIARELSEILGLDYRDIYEKSGRRGSWYVTVARKVEADKADAIRRFKAENKISGVRLETDTKRYYPNGRLACHLLGFVGTDNYGLEGDEQVDKKSDLVVKLKEWIDAEYAGGRQTSLSNEELETRIEALSNGKYRRL